MEYTEFDGDVQVFSFGLEIPSLCKSIPKIQICLFTVKFDTYTYSNLRNLIMMFISFIFWTRNILFSKNGPKFLKFSQDIVQGIWFDYSFCFGKLVENPENTSAL